MYDRELIPRYLEESDWDTLKEWWDYWPGVKAPSKDFLPDNGTGGIMIEENGTPIIACFIYQTNSSTAMLEWLISNPNYRGKKKRDRALEALIISAQAVVKSMGYKSVFTMLRHQKLINLRNRFGWKIESKPSYTHTKIL